jgi:hypothetical protein
MWTLARMLAGQDKAQRADADEVVGEEALQAPGVVLLFGRSPALHQVEDIGHCQVPPGG